MEPPAPGPPPPIDEDDQPPPASPPERFSEPAAAQFLPDREERPAAAVKRAQDPAKKAKKPKKAKLPAPTPAQVCELYDQIVSFSDGTFSFRSHCFRHYRLVFQTQVCTFTDVTIYPYEGSDTLIKLS